MTPEHIVGYFKIMRKITPRQKQLLQIIYDYFKQSGYPPTIEEMRGALGVASNQSVLDLLHHLESKKCLKRGEGVARSIAILPYGYEILGKPKLAPFLGFSHAGAPIGAIEVEGDWKSLPGEVASLDKNVFLLKVMGDSMINAGIDDGDVLLVQEKQEFISGEIVVAERDGETTIKRFISDDKPPFIYLKPENPEYAIIPFDEQTRLKGKVISVMNSGQWRPVE